MIRNWLILAVGVLELGGSVQFVLAGQPRLAAMNACVAVANLILSTVGGDAT